MSQAPPPPPSAPPAAELPSNAYSNAFTSLRPRDGAQLLQTRLHKARIVVEELAEYFAARRELESAYLKALQKISRRTFLSDPSALGPSFVPVYERLIAEIGQVASIHGELESKIGQECEAAMRTAPNKGEWGRQKDHDDGISATLKEIQTLEQQLQKDQKKLDTASSKKAGSAQAKVIETQRSLDQALDLWQTEAPFAFEAYQRIDAQRLELMKEAITRFETAQSDAAQRLMGVTEQTLQATLAFDPQAEMQEFVLKNGGASSSSRRDVASATAATPATPQRRRTLVQRTDSIASSARASARTNGGGARGDRGEFGGVDSSSNASVHSTNNNDQSSQPSRGGSTLKSAFGRFGRGRSNKQGGAGDTTTIYGGPAATSSANTGYSGNTLRPNTAGERRGTLSSLHSNDGAGGGDDDDDDDDNAVLRPPPPASSRLMQPMTPTRAGAAGAAASPVPASSASAFAPASASASASAPRVDSEGYSIPPPDRKPWETVPTTDEQEELSDNVNAGANANTSRMSSMNISHRPLSPSDNAQDAAALEKVRSALATSATPARRGTTRRDRRDVRNTTYNPMDNGSLSSIASGGAGGVGAGQFGTIAPQLTGGSAFGPGAGAGAASAFANPFETGGAPAMATSSSSHGLRASITETVNAILTSGGSVARLMVVGEVAVASTAGTSERLHLRVDAFEQLEKAAANPVFLQALPSRPGEYTLDTSKISSASSTSSPATILKYQLHVPADKMARYAPVTVDAKWRFEAHQTSLLLNYAQNPECRIATATTDVSFVVPIGPTEVTNVMSKPEGAWDAASKRITWNSGSENSGKILARFQVDGQGAAQGVQVKWRALGQTVSALGLELVGDTGGAQFADVVRQTVSGKYIAQ